MRKPFIYIPTFGRVHSQITYRFFSETVRRNAVLVCVEREAAELQRQGANVLVQPPEINTIVQKRQWIVDQHTGSPVLFMLDDDLRFCVRDPVRGQGKEAGSVTLNTAKYDDVDTLFRQWYAQLGKYAHAGISARAGNQSRVPGWHENKRMMYALGYDVATLRKYGGKFNDIRFREDMYVCLNLLTSGHRNSVTYEYAVDQVYNKSGGESAAGRNMVESNAAAEHLATLFPGVVKAEQRAYKASIPRTEVTVQWVKAFNPTFEI